MGFAESELTCRPESSTRKEPRAFIVVHTNKIVSHPSQKKLEFSADELEGLGKLNLSAEAEGHHHMYLGHDPSGVAYFAIDLGDGYTVDKKFHLHDVRSLMTECTSRVAMSRAGLAVAFARWHSRTKFCSRCGTKTMPHKRGTRRICDNGHNQYPRTDPVAIVVVEHPEGHSLLLGRSQKIVNKNMLTCLSGFVDFGETVQQAAAREVNEESGILVDRVEMICSQPWPLGRGGNHEIMIGCYAIATTTDIFMDPEEMDVVRWVHFRDIKRALQEETTEFHIPPGYALANSLLTWWVEKKSFKL